MSLHLPGTIMNVEFKSMMCTSQNDKQYSSPLRGIGEVFVPPLCILFFATTQHVAHVNNIYYTVLDQSILYSWYYMCLFVWVCMKKDTVS